METNDMNKKDLAKLIKYVDEQIKILHKTCTKNDYDNGKFWAYKDIQKWIN